MLYAVAVKKAWFLGALGLAGAALMGCGGEEPAGVVVEVEAQPFTVRSVDWNPQAVDVGKVAAVAENGGVLAVLADTGSTVFSGGVVTATDGSVKGWTAASVIPAADGNGRWIAGADGRVGSASEGKARIFEAASASELSHELSGAEQATFDAAGKLVVRTADAIYAEDGEGNLALRYRAKAGALRELAASDVRVWVVEGTELLSIEADGVLRTEGAGISATARLLGSPSGDVWSVDGGALSRFAAETGDSEDRSVWEKDVQPVYLGSCTPCHEPGGSAGADLSTYGAWVARREQIKDRVVVAKTMPPTGIEFTEEGRAAIAGWIAGGAP